MLKEIKPQCLTFLEILIKNMNFSSLDGWKIFFGLTRPIKTSLYKHKHI